METLDDLDPADAYKIIRAICNYYTTGVDPTEQFTGALKATVRLMYQQIKRAEQVSEVRAEAARSMHEKHSFAVQKDANVKQESTQVLQKSATETETNTNTETLKKETLPKGRVKKESAPRFSPPTLKEVEEYCKSRNSSVDPKAFWEFFNEGNWKDSKGQPVRNWKQKVLTWERYIVPNDVPTKRKAPAAPKESSFDTDDFMLASLKRVYGEAGA